MKSDREIWFEWMLPNSLIAAGLIPLMYCAVFYAGIPLADKAVLYVGVIFLGIVLGFAIGLLQWMLSARKSSMAYEWWGVLLLNALLWSISTFVGTFLSIKVSTSLYPRDAIGEAIVGLIAWPIFVWIIGVVIQGGMTSLSLRIFSD